MATTGLDPNLTLRSNYAAIAITQYAINKLRDGDHECHNTYMLIVDRIVNLRVALDSVNLIETLSDIDIYCLNAKLFALMNENQHIPGMIPASEFQETSTGIGSMNISTGIGQIFTIQ